ncbi:MAG: hypothetical protein LAT68_10065 [Cyclobacteriaceae bacterium]|nr:hypothetical protein [Cyclobacteriaceae bacterium]MCH8516659.1 hypothetical protein [Cyclobacteriaceae bacterium]
MKLKHALSLLFITVAVIGCDPNHTDENNQLSFEKIDKPKSYSAEGDADDVSDILQEEITELPSYIANELADDHRFLFATSGDLTKDRREDLIVITEFKETNDEDSANWMRRISIFDNYKDSSEVVLSFQSDSLVLCSSCGGSMGDPFVGIIIESPIFTISHYGGSSWRWTREQSFIYNAQVENWMIYRDAESSYHSSKPADAAEKVRTKKDLGNQLIKTVNIYQSMGN